MLDIRWLQTHPEEAAGRLAARSGPSPAEALRLDAEQRKLLAEVERLRGEQRRLSLEINERRKGGRPHDDLAEPARDLSDALAAREPALRALDAALHCALLQLPNLPHPDVPAGLGPDDNRVVRTWGEPRRASWARPHWEIGRDLGILEFAGATRMAAPRFYALLAAGAALQRALSHLMLSLATAAGFTEVSPPLLVNARAIEGTGQLPKFGDDLFRTREGLYLIPTAEVPLVNLHREEILDGASLPRRYVASTPCFREEVGAPGKVTRGMVRVHQFEKVEVVSLCRPAEAARELDAIVARGEAVLQALGIPYRIVELCAGELGFSAARTYDLEAWFPGLGRYLEVSSCSDCGDFQARRAGIRFRDGKGRPQLVHTLNGSALAVGRTLAAVLENYQEEDGRVAVPAALQPLMGGVEHLQAR